MVNLADESIYNLLPPAPVRAQRCGLNLSTQHSMAVNVGPSYSTFPSKLTNDGAAASLYRGSHAAIGRLVGGDIDPAHFLRRGAGAKALAPVGDGATAAATAAANNNNLNNRGAGGGDAGGGSSYARSSSKRSREARKIPVPPRADRPVMGLATDKNFVHSNAIEVICSAPRNVRRDAPRPTEGKDFAKVPEYLLVQKQRVADERRALELQREMRVAQVADDKAQYVRQMDEDERDHLSRGLRKVWADKYRCYQALPFAKDTALQIARKENLERDLKEIEASLEKLERPVLFVHRDDTIGLASYARRQALHDSELVAKRMVTDAISQQRASGRK